MFHFKTVWCPYADPNHQKENCVYAHNWQDYRRKPHIYGYSSQACPNWDTKATVTDYEGACKDGLRCKYAHGRRESAFHPEMYKKSDCQKADCQMVFCPLAHNPAERIEPTPEFFKPTPRSRNVYFPTNYYKGELGANKSPRACNSQDIFANRLPHTKINKRDLAASQSNSSSNPKLLSVHSTSFMPAVGARMNSDTKSHQSDRPNSLSNNPKSKGGHSQTRAPKIVQDTVRGRSTEQGKVKNFKSVIAAL